MHTMFGGQRALKKTEANLSKALSKAQLSPCEVVGVDGKRAQNF